MTAMALGGTLLLAACGSAGTSRPPASRPATAAPASTAALLARINAISDLVTKWQHATSLAQVKLDAEQVRNLVVGPHGPGYGDANHDGSTEGATTIGLLPGLAGQPGLAAIPAANSCIEQHVLGGSWSDPGNRWQIAQTAAANWKPDNNTFPALPSQPQRIYGWATLALNSTDFAAAKGYANDAAMHVEVTRQSVTSCTA